MNKKLSRLMQPGPLVFFVILAVFALVCLVMKQYVLMLAACAAFFLTVLWFRIDRSRRRKALADYVKQASEAPQAFGAIPYASALVQPQTGEILWTNDKFNAIAQPGRHMNPRKFSDVFEGADLGWLKDGKSEADEPLVHGKQRYRVAGSLIRSADEPDTAVAAVYLVDETQLLLLKDEYSASRPVVSVILIDNYDELTNNLPDSNVSNLNAAIDTRIKYWTDGIGGLLRKVERNRYLFFFEAKDLPAVIEQKFSILETIRTITNPRGVHATISLGIGKDGRDFSDGYAAVGDSAFMTTPMKKEVDRCVMAFEEAMKDKSVAMICSGDAGVYGMSGLILEIGRDYPEVEVCNVSGVTAAIGGAAVLGAPLIHDFAVISLSDLLTPWEKIEKRLLCAAEADLSIVLYNPSSIKRHDYLQKACDLMMQFKSPETVCGTVQNIGREGEVGKIYTLRELRDTKVDMFTTVFVGNSQTTVIDGKMVTPRGYKLASAKEVK